MVNKNSCYGKSRLTVVLLIILIGISVSCDLIVSNFSQYGRMLLSSITPGLQAQVFLDIRVRQLINAPDGNGVLVLLEDGSITYYDSNLKAVNSWQYTGSGQTLDQDSIGIQPAHSTFITSGGNQYLMVTAYKKLQRLFLFADTKTFVKKYYTAPNFYPAHTVEIPQESKNSFDFTSTGIVYYDNESKLQYKPADLDDPIIIQSCSYPRYYARGDTMYALAMTAEIQDNFLKYNFSLYSASYSSSVDIEIGNFNQELMSFTAQIPPGFFLEYFFINDAYIAVILSKQSDIPEIFCIAFSRIDGREISTIHFTSPTDEKIQFAFGTERIYTALNDILYAVEVRP